MLVSLVALAVVALALLLLLVLAVSVLVLFTDSHGTWETHCCRCRWRFLLGHSLVLPAACTTAPG